MLLKSLVKAYVHDSADPVVLGQYVEHLEQMLARLRSNGADADDLRSKLVTALQNKNTGGFINLACEVGVAGYFLTAYPDMFR